MTGFLYWYAVKSVAVVDADTVDVSIDLGFHTLRVERLRLYGPDPDGGMGLDAPEMRTPEGKAAKAWLVERLRDKDVVVRTVKDKKGKYGRYLAILYARDAAGNWSDVNRELLDAGHAALKKY